VTDDVNLVSDVTDVTLVRRNAGGNLYFRVRSRNLDYQTELLIRLEYQCSSPNSNSVMRE
jgi:hypothetical protein